MRFQVPSIGGLALLLACVGSQGSLVAEDAQAEGIRFFEQRIRPVLVGQCYECHSAEASPLQGGLRLDFKQGLLLGGDSGAAIVPGEPEQSVLLKSLHYDNPAYQMPPDGKLPPGVIADFEKWIAMGAPDPREETSADAVRKPFDIDSRRNFWSFQPPQAWPSPMVEKGEWPQTKIDHFILAAQQEAGLQPAPSADRRTLIRRAYLGLTGLPPSFAEVEEFVHDPDPAAYRRLIERLLASPHYGERWARHWLDVVRYAEDNVNMGPHNGPYPHAYRYRDWVVAALNVDMPFDEFIQRQLATDFLDHTGPEDLPALGLIGLSPQYHKELLLAKAALEDQYADEWEDRVDVIGRGLLGLTVACARCHDHKFDPISSKDYYALAGVFASVRQTLRPVISDEEIATSQPARDEVQALEEKIVTATAEVAALKKTENKALDHDRQVEDKSMQIAAHKREIERIKSTTPQFEIPVAEAVTEEQVRIEELSETNQQIVFYPNEPRDLPVYIRGNLASPGEIVPRRFVEVLTPGQPKPFAQGSGRLELAKAIVADSNPLTARVFVNRVWMHHFGEGLVDSPSNFGTTGSRPSHPELLDDLAVRFMQEGWSLKWLHQEIMLSSTYQQASQVKVTDNARAIDPENRLLSRFNRRRLEAEVYRDGLLTAGGNLNATIGGLSGDIDRADFNRRAIYAKISRQSPSQYLQIHDFPDPTIHAERRAETTTSLQQLFVMNSPFVKRQAALLAGRVAPGEPQDRIREVYRLLLGRDASSQEIQVGLDYLTAADAGQTASGPATGPPRFEGARLQAHVPKLGETYSVELWLRNEVPATERPIAGYFFSRGEDGRMQTGGDHLGVMGTHQPEHSGKLIHFNGEASGVAFFGRTTLIPDRWYHVVLIREANEVRAYLNGDSEPELIGQASPDFSRSKEAKVFIGGRNDNFANLRGHLGSVSVYDRALTVQDIALHFKEADLREDRPNFQQHHRAVIESAPLAVWPLYRLRQLPAVVRDQSPHGHHATYDAATSTGYGSQDPWILYCHGLLCSNELMYVD